MNKSVLSVIGCAAWLAMAGISLSAQTASHPGDKKSTIVWSMPPGNNNGAAWKELFDHPDEWTVARSRTTVLGYADHNLATQFKDDELRRQFALMNEWHLKLGLEVGAIKEWGPTGAIAFAKTSKMWDRFIADGAPLDAVAMDEPLAAATNKLGKTPQYAVDETAAYIALVRQKYPKMRVGDIEPYPGIQTPLLLAFLDALQAKLAAMHVRGLDFYRLDVDWMHFHPGDPIGVDGWTGVKDLQKQVNKRGLPFGLCYWAADYPSLNKANKATDMTWENAIMRQGDAYHFAGGVPDEYIIESWVGSPSHSVPETQPGTFMKSVDDFTAKWVPLPK